MISIHRLTDVWSADRASQSAVVFKDNFGLLPQFVSSGSFRGVGSG
jgi:hypothetical protein